jgi:hypothetical protein
MHIYENAKSTTYLFGKPVKFVPELAEQRAQLLADVRSGKKTLKEVRELDC